MDKRGNISIFVISFLFIVFSLFVVYRPDNNLITGKVTASFENSNKFYVNQLVNGSVSITIEGNEKLRNDTTFQLGIYGSDSTQYALEINSFDFIFNKTFNLEKKPEADYFYFKKESNARVFKYELLNFSLKYNTIGSYKLRFMKRELTGNLITLVEKDINLVEAPSQQVGITDKNFVMNLTLTGLNVIKNQDGEEEFLAYSGDFRIYDLLACIVKFKDESPVEISFYSQGAEISQPFLSVEDVINSRESNVLCERSSGLVECAVMLNVTTFKPGFWRCLAKQGGLPNISEQMNMVNTPVVFKGNLSNFAITKNGEYVAGTTPIDLDNYFYDPDGQRLQYGVVGTKFIAVTAQQDGRLLFGNSRGFEGVETVTFRAYDGFVGAFSNAINIKVGSGQVTPGGQQCYPLWDCGVWSNCINGMRTRTCVDENNCRNILGKPTESEDCGEESGQGERGRTDKGTTQLPRVVPEASVKLTESKIKGPWRIVLIVVLIVSLLGTGGFLLYWFKFRKPLSSKIITGQVQEKAGGQGVSQDVKSGMQGQQPQGKQGQAVNLEEMKKYVESMLDQGEQDAKIRSDLIATGWNKADVDNIVNYLVLKKFVKSKLSAGFTKDKIQESLLAKGWKKEVVDKVFLELKI